MFCLCFVYVLFMFLDFIYNSNTFLGKIIKLIKIDLCNINI